MSSLLIDQSKLYIFDLRRKPNLRDTSYRCTKFVCNYFSGVSITTPKGGAPTNGRNIHTKERKKVSCNVTVTVSVGSVLQINFVLGIHVSCPEK